jgi:hypothetical protein
MVIMLHAFTYLHTHTHTPLSPNYH